ncbi:DCL family protein [Kitasatospora sp. NPDC006697]|uniref:DCL family protein n=1 Tax=Kitasatospora sp. NPDC006697 TaxID=3364020 RepID=UPI0036D0107C
MTYTVGTEKFNTKAHLTQRCIDIRNKYQPLKDATVSDSGEDDFLRALLRLHQDAADKIGQGIDHFEVRRNEPWGTYGFWAIRIDGTEDDFSYPHIIGGLSPD